MRILLLVAALLAACSCAAGTKFYLAACKSGDAAPTGWNMIDFVRSETTLEVVAKPLFRTIREPSHAA